MDDQELLTPRLAGADFRRRAASRAPINVFVGHPVAGHYQVDTSPCWWPYRALRVSDIRSADVPPRPTVDRCHKLQVIDQRNPGRAYPHECFAAASEVHADDIVPHASVTARDQISAPRDLYDLYNPEERARLVVPVPHPHEFTIQSLTGGDLQRSVKTQAIALCGLHWLDAPGLHSVVRRAADTLPSDVEVHLINPPLSLGTISAIRNRPGLIDRITLTPAWVPDDYPTHEALVATASELSYRTSTLCDADTATSRTHSRTTLEELIQTEQRIATGSDEIHTQPTLTSY